MPSSARMRSPSAAARSRILTSVTAAAIASCRRSAESLRRGIGAGAAPSSWSRRPQATLVEHVRHDDRGHAGLQRRAVVPAPPWCTTALQRSNSQPWRSRRRRRRCRAARHRRSLQRRGSGPRVGRRVERLEREPVMPCGSASIMLPKSTHTGGGPASRNSSSSARRLGIDGDPRETRSRSPSSSRSAWANRRQPPGCTRAARACPRAASRLSGSRQGSGGSPAARRAGGEPTAQGKPRRLARRRAKGPLATAAGRAQAYPYELRARMPRCLPADQHRELVGDDHLGSLAGGERVAQPLGRRPRACL